MVHTGFLFYDLRGLPGHQIAPCILATQFSDGVPTYARVDQYRIEVSVILCAKHDTLRNIASRGIAVIEESHLHAEIAEGEAWQQNRMGIIRLRELHAIDALVKARVELSISLNVFKTGFG